MISDIRLQQYRSYKDATFKLSPGVNVVVGPNASGKTNLLESLFVVGRGRSYRATDQELIMHGELWSRIDFSYSGDRLSLKLNLLGTPVKQFVVNDKALSRFGDAARVPVILFEPNHLNLLFGPPEDRRRYLDDILEQIESPFCKLKKDYEKVLRQRNSLLKRGLVRKDEIFPWDVRLGHLGGLIVASRLKLINELNKDIEQVYEAIASRRAVIDLSYKTKFKVDQYESQLLKKLEQSFELDVLRGFTASGPHRDDLDVTINGKSITAVASRGETRTIMIGLKTLEAEIVSRNLENNPIILLDDVFGELDKNRTKRLMSSLGRYQSVITTTDFDYVPKLDNNANVIKM